MWIQLTSDFTPRHQREQRPIIGNEAWIDVSDIALGVGFTTPVHISVTLNDVLQSLQSEIDCDYDQRLYDALWQAYFRLLLDQSQSVTFNFMLTRRNLKTGEASEVSLRLRVEVHNQVVQFGLLKD